MKSYLILKKLHSLHALESNKLGNAGHEFTSILFCFHALGWKLLCNVRHEISHDLKEIAFQILQIQIKSQTQICEFEFEFVCEFEFEYEWLYLNEFEFEFEWVYLNEFEFEFE